MYHFNNARLKQILDNRYQGSFIKFVFQIMRKARDSEN